MAKHIFYVVLFSTITGIPQYFNHTLNMRFLGCSTLLKNVVKALCLSRFDVHPILSINNFRLGYFLFELYFLIFLSVYLQQLLCCFLLKITVMNLAALVIFIYFYLFQDHFAYYQLGSSELFQYYCLTDHKHPLHYDQI